MQIKRSKNKIQKNRMKIENRLKIYVILQEHSRITCSKREILVMNHTNDIIVLFGKCKTFISFVEQSEIRRLLLIYERLDTRLRTSRPGKVSNEIGHKDIGAGALRKKSSVNAEKHSVTLRRTDSYRQTD